MCGAITVKYDPSFKDELLNFFSPQEIESFARTGEVIFAFWDKRPVLPIKQGGKIRFVEWGDRDGSLGLPKTGWARLESLQAGKWNHLSPKVVLVPAIKGCDKNVWFNLSSEIRAVLINKNEQERVYMITEQASDEFLDLTGHDRMPRLMS